jgi:phospholipase/carboxylesterase
VSDLLPCLVHEPGGEVTGAVIWLHGLGADGSDFVPLVPHIGLPSTRFVFPNAPHAPVTINSGMVMPSWYDIRSLDHDRTDREDPAGVRASAELVRALIAREVDRGVPESRIVLAGFSQGGALALFTGLRHPAALAGIVCLSGYLVLDDTLDAEVTAAGRSAAVLFCHGTRDDVVPVAGGREAHRRVAALGASAAWHDFPMGHEVNAEEVRVIRRFLHERLPGR